jgi:hypothetical protein
MHSNSCKFQPEGGSVDDKSGDWETEHGTGVGEKKSGESEDSMATASAGREATGRAEGQGPEKIGGKK